MRRKLADPALCFVCCFALFFGLLLIVGERIERAAPEPQQAAVTRAVSRPELLPAPRLVVSLPPAPARRPTPPPAVETPELLPKPVCLLVPILAPLRQPMRIPTPCIDGLNLPGPLLPLPGPPGAEPPDDDNDLRRDGAE